MPPDGAPVPPYMLDHVVSFPYEFLNEDGEFRVELIDGQDVMAWCTPGPIADRTAERLGWTDRGVIHWRKMLLRELENIEAGRDPLGTIRDPAKNEIIELPIEHGRAQFEEGFAIMSRKASWRFYPHLEELIDLFTRSRRREPAAV